MPRPIIGGDQKLQGRGPSLRLGGSGGAEPHTRREERVQLTPRPERLTEILRKLDIGGHTPAQLSSLFDELRGLYGVAATPPLGLVARCFLGNPFEAHVIDLMGSIVEHYHLGKPMPTPFERGRKLSLHASYAAVEIYETRLVAIRHDGSVIELQG